MGKSMEKVLGPVINEIRKEGLIGRWEKERELKTVRKNRRSLNKEIRQKAESLGRGKGKNHG
jgi:hypothetical protein